MSGSEGAKAMTGGLIAFLPIFVVWLVVSLISGASAAPNQPFEPSALSGTSPDSGASLTPTTKATTAAKQTCAQIVAAGGTIQIQTGNAQPVNQVIGTGRTGQQGVFSDSVSLHESQYFESLGCAVKGNEWLVVEFKDHVDLKFATTISYSFIAVADTASSSISIADSAGNTYVPVTLSVDAKSGSRTAIFAVPESKKASYQVTANLAYTGTRDTSRDINSSDSEINVVPATLAPTFVANTSVPLDGSQQGCKPFETVWC